MQQDTKTGGKFANQLEALKSMSLVVADSGATLTGACTCFSASSATTPSLAELS